MDVRLARGPWDEGSAPTRHHETVRSSPPRPSTFRPSRATGSEQSRPFAKVAGGCPLPLFPSGPRPASFLVSSPRRRPGVSPLARRCYRRPGPAGHRDRRPAPLLLAWQQGRTRSYSAVASRCGELPRQRSVSRPHAPPPASLCRRASLEALPSAPTAPAGPISWRGYWQGGEALLSVLFNAYTLTDVVACGGSTCERFPAL